MPVRAETRGDRSLEFKVLQRSFIILKVPETLPERVVQQSQTEPVHVARSKTSALTAVEEQRQRKQSQSELPSNLAVGVVS